MALPKRTDAYTLLCIKVIPRIANRKTSAHSRAPHLLFKQPSNRRCFDSVENPHIGATASFDPSRSVLNADGLLRVPPSLPERQAALRDDPPSKERRLVTGRCVDGGSKASRHHSAATFPCSRSPRFRFLAPESVVVAPVPPRFPPTLPAAATSMPAVPTPPPSAPAVASASAPAVPTPLPPSERNGSSRDAAAETASTRRGDKQAADVEEALLLSRPDGSGDTEREGGGRCTPSSSIAIGEKRGGGDNDDDAFAIDTCSSASPLFWVP